MESAQAAEDPTEAAASSSASVDKEKRPRRQTSQIAAMNTVPAACATMSRSSSRSGKGAWITTNPMMTRMIR